MRQQFETAIGIQTRLPPPSNSTLRRMARVVFDRINKRFSERKRTVVHALNHISLTINESELFVFVGPSGSGKTTLLRLIAGLEVPDEGTLTIAERVVNDVPPQERDVAMIFQNQALYPHMTVYDNIAFGLQLRTTPKKEIIRRVGEAADLLQIQSKLDHFPATLSGGERQRVAIARAIVRKPAVFLFDEPLSNLDSPLRLQMRREIASLHQRLGTTMIYVTHDQTEAMTLGHRIGVLRDGIVEQVAPPLDLYFRPANVFVAGFIGSPPMNFLRGELISTSSGLEFSARQTEAPVTGPHQTLPLPETVAARLSQWRGKKLILGIRPEDIHVVLTGPADLTSRLMRATIELIEPLGSDTCLYLMADGWRFSVRTTGMQQSRLHDPVAMNFDLSKSHFFDAASGKAIV